MIEADCPDHLCLKQRAVDSTGGTIVCLPNKVVIEGIKGTSSDETSPEFGYCCLTFILLYKGKYYEPEKIANLGLFAAVAIIFGYVESLIPFLRGSRG